MKERYKDEALGDENMREQYWQELKEAITLDNQKLWDDNNAAAEVRLLRAMKAAESMSKFPSEILQQLDKELKENSIPNKTCHQIGLLLLQAYRQLTDGTKLTERRIKEHEE